MNKQEGFTLIEMISVIALIGVIGLTMTLGLSGIQKNQKTKKKDNAYAKVKSAMNVYTSTGGSFKNNNPDERLNTLVEEELITKEDKNLCYDDNTCQTFVSKYVVANKNVVNDISSNIKINGKSVNDNSTIDLDKSDIIYSPTDRKFQTSLNIKTSDKNSHILVSANNSQTTGTGSLTYVVKLTENAITTVTVTIYDKNYINKKTITYKLKTPILNYMDDLVYYAAFQNKDENSFNYINPTSSENTACFRSINVSPKFTPFNTEYTISVKKSCKYVLLQFRLANNKVINKSNAYFVNGTSSCKAKEVCYVIAKLNEGNETKLHLDSIYDNSRTTYTFKYEYVN